MSGVLGGMEVVGESGGGMSPGDIDTLVKLNAIFVDGTVLADAVAALAAANGYTDTQVAIVSGRIRAPVDDIVALRALASAGLLDKQLCLCEASEAIYSYDVEGVGADDGDGTIIPDDIIFPAPGRWFKTTVASQNHETLTGILGGAAPNNHYHLTAGQVGLVDNALQPGDVGTAAAEDVGTGIGDIPVLEDVGGGTPGLPAIDGSQLTGISAGIPAPTGVYAVDGGALVYDGTRWLQGVQDPLTGVALNAIWTPTTPAGTSITPGVGGLVLHQDASAAGPVNIYTDAIPRVHPFEVTLYVSRSLANIETAVHLKVYEPSGSPWFQTSFAKSAGGTWEYWTGITSYTDYGAGLPTSADFWMRIRWVPGKLQFLYADMDDSVMPADTDFTGRRDENAIINGADLRTFRIGVILTQWGGNLAHTATIKHFSFRYL